MEGEGGSETSRRRAGIYNQLKGFDTVFGFGFFLPECRASSWEVIDFERNK